MESVSHLLHGRSPKTHLEALDLRIDVMRHRKEDIAANDLLTHTWILNDLVKGVRTKGADYELKLKEAIDAAMLENAPAATPASAALGSPPSEVNQDTVRVTAPPAVPANIPQPTDPKVPVASLSATPGNSRQRKKSKKKRRYNGSRKPKLEPNPETAAENSAEFLRRLPGMEVVHGPALPVPPSLLSLPRTVSSPQSVSIPMEVEEPSSQGAQAVASQPAACPPPPPTYLDDGFRRLLAASYNKHDKTEKYPSVCVLCGLKVAGRMRDHVLQSHLPWYFEPTRVCWSCQRPTGGTGFLTAQHKECDNPWLDDARMAGWVWRMNCLFQYLADYFGAEDPKKFFGNIVKWGWTASRFGRINPSPVLVVLMRMWELTNHGARAMGWEELSSSPLPGLPALANWRNMVCVLEHTSIQFRECFRLMDGQVILRPVPRGRVVPCRPLTIDAHCHLTRTLKDHNVRTLWDLKKKVHDGDVELQHVVNNAVTQEEWDDIERLNVDPTLSVVNSFGLHPHDASDEFSVQSQAALSQLVSLPSCCAVGEIGLDYHRHADLDERRCQKENLGILCAMALKFGKPVIVHCRPRSGEQPEQIVKDCIEEMRKILPAQHPVHIHCFSGGVLEYNLWHAAFSKSYFGISALLFGGVGVKRQALEKVVSNLSLDELLLETDSPYLPPPGVSVANHPWAVGKVAERVSQLMRVSKSLVLEVARRNACLFYGLQV